MQHQNPVLQRYWNSVWRGHLALVPYRWQDASATQGRDGLATIEHSGALGEFTRAFCALQTTSRTLRALRHSRPFACWQPKAINAPSAWQGHVL